MSEVSVSTYPIVAAEVIINEIGNNGWAYAFYNKINSLAKQMP